MDRIWDSTNGFSMLKNIQIDAKITQIEWLHETLCKSYKINRHFGKQSACHLWFSNVHLFRFDKCFKIFLVKYKLVIYFYVGDLYEWQWHPATCFVSSHEWLIPHGYLLLTNDAVNKFIEAFSKFSWSSIK